VSFVPGETGTYRVGVKLAQCGADACAYGVAVFRRDAAVAGRAASARAKSR